MKLFTRSVFLCLATVALLFDCHLANAQVGGLTFRPVDAAYSLTLDKIILISANPNQLHIYDPVAQSDRRIALSAAPQNVSLSPDGTHAAVAFSTAVVYVDLPSATISKTFSNVAVSTGRVICGSGYIDVFPSYQGSILSIDIATEQTTTDSGFIYASGGTFDPAVNSVYSTENGLSPNSLHRFDISGGVVGKSTTQPSGYFGLFNICGPLWLSHDGLTIYSACGTVYQASSDSTKDMRYLGVLPGVSNAQSLTTSDSLNQIAVIPAVQPYAQPAAPLADTVVTLYSSSSFNPVGQFATTPFQVNSISFPAHGRWVFYNSSSSAMFIITQADSSAGLQQDYAIENITLANPNSCNTSFVTASASAIGAGSYATAQILSGEDCVFTAVSNVPWITLTAGYYGSGDTTLTYLVRPNLSAASRSGTISAGSDTLTVYQDAAAPASPLNPLSFKPVAAAYDKSLDKIIMVSTSPNELHIYDAVSQADQIVPLTYIPLSLSVRPDGLSAAVGHSGEVSIVDLQQQTVIETIPVDMDNGGIALAANGYAYTFPSQTGAWGNINSIQLSTGTLTTLQDVYYGNIPRLDVSGNYLYVSSIEIGASKLNISNGPATLAAQFLSTLGGNIWLTEDGARLINWSGNVFFTSAVPAQDIQPDGKLRGATTVDWAAESQVQQQIAILTDPAADSNTVLQIYANQGLLLKGETAIPGFSNNGTIYASHGKYLFWNADASKLFAITEADSKSGLLSDYAVYTIAAPESLPACTYSVSPASLNVPPSYSSWVFNVASNCSWTALSSSTWLWPAGFGSTNGNGQFAVNVQNNSGGPRSGSIAVGNQAIAVNQAASTCSYSLSSTSTSFSQSGGTGAVNLTTGAGCSWSVQSNSSWVSVKSSPSGSGPAAIQFSVAPATSSAVAQYGSLNIAGLTFSIAQTTASKIASFAVWRPSSGTWFILDSTATNSYPTPSAQQQWGLPGDIPVPGDYDGDGKTDYAVWRPSNGTWFIVPSGTPAMPIVQQWGSTGDVPLVGDFNGDGKADFTVWRPSTGTWFVLYSSGAGSYPTPSLQQQWGSTGDVPLAGDFNGDGRADFTVWRRSTGTWFVLYSSAAGSYPTPSLQQQWGVSSDVPLAGDFNGDRKADFTVWRRSTGTWFVLYNGAASSYPTPSLQQQWGWTSDVPLVADFNGDRKADFTVWRRSTGTWFVLYNGAASSYPTPSLQQQWGSPGDVPVRADF